MRVIIDVIPHDQQRCPNPSCGDWLWTKDDNPFRDRLEDVLNIRVSALGDWRMEMAVAIHELTEALACKHRLITEQQVDAYDTGAGADSEEPGDEPDCPYRREHRAAYVTEFALLDTLDVSISEYNAKLRALV